MVCNEKGFAMVSVVFLLALLLVLATMVSREVLQSTQAVSQAAVRQRIELAVQAGMEWARRELGNNYLASEYWRDYLTAETVGGAYPRLATFTTELADARIEVFVRDNLEEDNDPKTDTDLTLEVLVVATNAFGSQAVGEAVCMIAAGAVENYRQLGQGLGRSNLANNAQIPDLDQQRLSRYRLED